MSSESALLAICLLAAMFAVLGFGITAVFWTIISSITTRVRKPKKHKLFISFVWAAISSVLMFLLVLLFVPSHGAVVLLLLTVPVAALASIAGACYDSSDD